MLSDVCLYEKMDLEKKKMWRWTCENL